MTKQQEADYLRLRKKEALRRINLNHQFGVITYEEAEALEKRIEAGDEELLEHYAK